MKTTHIIYSYHLQVAVTEKTLACETLLADITKKTEAATEKKELATAKATEIEEQNKVIIYLINLVTQITKFFKIFFFQLGDSG